MSFAVFLQFARLSVLAAGLFLAEAASADEAKPIDLEATRNALTAIETSLKAPALTDADLQQLRALNDPIGVALQAAIADWTPRLAASAKRLAELTPKSKEPKDAAPAANDAAAADLANEKSKNDALDSNLRAARAMLLEVDDNATRIGTKRRELFARETFARSSSVFNPQLWVSVWREVPIDVGVMTALVSGWVASLESRLTLQLGLTLIGLLAASALVAGAVHWIDRKMVFRDPDVTAPSRLRRAVAAAWAIFVLAGLPMIGLLALALALDAFNLADSRMRSVLDAVFDAARLVILFNAIGRGLLAPRCKAWRLVGMSDRSASLIFRGGMTIAAIWAAERLVEPAADAVASLNIAIAARALGAILVALMGAATLRLVSPAQTAAAPLQPDVWISPRAFGWAAALVVFLAATTGYVAFASFLINQGLVLTMLASVLYLADVIIQDGTETLLRPDSRMGARLVAIVGLRRNVLSQIVVIVQGLARVAILIIAIAAVLEPLGLQSQDMFSTLRAAYFGFTLGGVTLSLSSIIGAAIVFGVVVLIVGLFREWLTSRLLPQTRLDAGMSNSISTILGYVGYILAVLMAAAQIGLDTEKLAIVAGALSVGIGFGLQSIANNFVSGLILLWERGIRVGDWIVVGPDQGLVRRISARATEIETFDRGTLIVPNSNLVTGVVKNWVLSDRMGRIIISVNVAYESDVEEVRQILIDAAKAQDLVLSIPAPSVSFVEFGDWALKFNLICFVEDIDTADRTRSEMNFDILRRMREANVRIPYPQFGQPRPEAK